MEVNVFFGLRDDDGNSRMYVDVSDVDEFVLVEMNFDDLYFGELGVDVGRDRCLRERYVFLDESEQTSSFVLRPVSANAGEIGESR